MAEPIIRMATESTAGSRRLTKRNTRTEAAPPTAQFESRPTQVFPRFHGSVGPPTVRPAMEAAGSPNAIMAQTAAAIGICFPEKTRMSRATIAG